MPGQFESAPGSDPSHDSDRTPAGRGPARAGTVAREPVAALAAGRHRDWHGVELAGCGSPAAATPGLGSGPGPQARSGPGPAGGGGGGRHGHGADGAGHGVRERPSAATIRLSCGVEASDRRQLAVVGSLSIWRT